MNIIRTTYDYKIDDIIELFINIYKTLLNIAKLFIASSIYEIHKEFIEYISEIGIDEQPLNGRFEKIASGTQIYYLTKIKRIIEEYLELESATNSKILKEHKKIIDSIRSFTTHNEKPQKIKLKDIQKIDDISTILGWKNFDTRPCKLAENLIKYCGGKAYKPGTELDSDDTASSQSNPVLSIGEYKFSDEED